MKNKYIFTTIFVMLFVFLIASVSYQQPMQNTKMDPQPMKNAKMDPQPIGGSEYNERVPRPVSNSLLQRMYPNTLVLRGSFLENKIALTFDDGPDPRFTPALLDVLKKYNAKATFFVMGSRAVAYPDIIRRMKDEGHAIGNHTYWHPNLADNNVARMRWEVEQTENVIQDILGYKTKLFRAPYGALNEDLVKGLGNLNNSAIGWSVDSLDWRQLPTDEIARNVLSNIHPGAIVLMHDGGHWTMDLTGTVESLHQIIPILQQEGMSFVTIPELANTGNKK